MSNRENQGRGSYVDFLHSKHLSANHVGFESILPINPLLKEFQAAVVRWALRLGRAAIFGGTGTGKTAMQLEWARHVCDYTNGNSLILAPLSVAHQTVREGQKFGIEVNYCRSQYGVKPGINITNYEMVKHFNPKEFTSIIPDESSILKSYMGKIKQEIIEFSSFIPFRLACTATPSPNDTKELGNHADFLGIMKSSEMLSKWFINDSMRAGAYRLKSNAREAFWQWVCGWAACFDKPSDLGFDDDEGYILPPLNIIDHVVDVDATENSENGYLFRTAELTATTLSRENRLTLNDRISHAARIVNESPDIWCLWCELNDEADALRRLIPDAVEVRGSDPIDRKEKNINLFSDGSIRVLISKTKICGFGMNWQHCHNTMFVGINYKYEPLFQAIRRFWRYGQLHPVNVHVIMAETEGPVMKALKRKQADHETMKAEMLRAMRESGNLDNVKRSQRLTPYRPDRGLVLPTWLEGGQAGETPESGKRVAFAVDRAGALPWAHAPITPRNEKSSNFMDLRPHPGTGRRK